MSVNETNDYELSEAAKQAMLADRYDDAIGFLRRMRNSAIAIKMELLVIEREQNLLRRVRQADAVEGAITA